MKTIGLIGGMSWESTVSYYQAINQGVKLALGGLHSAKVCLYSVDFDEIEKLQRENRWHDSAILLAKAAQAVEAAGADFVLICTNTMHKVADEVQAAVNIPLVHIADATAEQLVKDGIKRVGLLGTKFTMQEDFYKNRLTERFGIEVLVPSSTEQDRVHDVIYNELCLGTINSQSREQYLSVINHLYQQGAEAVILGCTEIALLVKPQHTDVPLYDTTQIHAACAVSLAIQS
ncbi:aspartate/glutamate racemase family protein [Shewanella subflava]|uniref:Aspartate/glutamate racemase family protein n=1 Tax=Shewanella subflava TaxID=2986476 RepID=A0ABT3IAQ2_9GAMM|nr:aspartate/glutamate racemase family protein [Shewanella subflava]MCW3173129.1 aspartate/glutamate racemase family protein [Shewanella subflava]